MPRAKCRMDHLAHHTGVYQPERDPKTEDEYDPNNIEKVPVQRTESESEASFVIVLVLKCIAGCPP